MRPVPQHLDGYAGTRWVLDASMIARDSVAPYTRLVDGGGVATGALNTPGGRFTLAGTQTGSLAELNTKPFSFGNSGGSLRAWQIEVEGLGSANKRGSFAAGFYASTNPGAFTKFGWDSTGMYVSTSTAVANATMKYGTVANVPGVDVGVRVDVPGNTESAFATAWAGGVEAKTFPGVFAAGMLDPAVSHFGVGEVFFRSIVVTAWWRIPGEIKTRILT